MSAPIRSGLQGGLGFLDGPSAELGAETSEFGRTRIARWFGTEW